MFTIVGKFATALCYATVVEDEAIEQVRRMLPAHRGQPCADHA